jgi:hypothetical protein
MGITTSTVGNVMDALGAAELVNKTKQRVGYLIAIHQARAKDLFIDGSTIQADGLFSAPPIFMP